jgi:hypothetical protein
MTLKNTITSRCNSIRFAVVLGVTALAFAAAPASSLAFGSKPTSQMQPSNSLPAHKCNQAADPCTWVMLEGYTLGNGVGSPKAPKDGTIHQLKLIAGGPGHFRFELAKVHPNLQEAKIVRKGPQIEYDGQQPGGDYEVETFNVNVPVHKGEYLAIQAQRTSMLRCSSGGPNTLQFTPALQLNGPFETASDDDGCWMLLQALY